MSWDALDDRGSGRPRRVDEPKGRAGRRSSRPASGLLSQNPRSRSLRARSGGATAELPAVIEEELWFGGHDPKAAEDTAARSMAALVGRIVGAKPFPESARRLADLTRREVVRIEPIIQVLERDPALSARLLRLVNSAGYALRQSCTSVRHAATLVGTDRLHQIATTAAVLDLFDSRSAIAARIIEHCTIVGAFCRYLGAHLALPVDDLFTAGFLHDIGKMMLLETEGDQYAALLEKFAHQPDAIHIAERSLYGFDHAVLAAHVLTEWNIPDPVPKIVAWHHDPARAYHVSSMMAALVQTVRLADGAVCAMMRGVPQDEFCSLASTESASYLDISEPQLASMWDELQTLYRESVEQCRGENAPALDPRSLRPKQPLSVAAAQEPQRTAELPLQFPCVVCGGPTFGNTCSACGGHMCPEHQVGREDWCTLCARDYHNQASETPSAMSPRLGAVIGVATVLISVAFGYETGGLSGGARAGVGTVLLLMLAAVLAVIIHRWLLRFRFVRTRPNRNIAEALENDGGVKSIVPPTMEHGGPVGGMGRDSLSENIRLSGAMVERVVIRDVPSIPDIIAPRPFDGLHGSPIVGSQPIVDEASLEVPKAPDSHRHRFDSERLMMQSQSLVTLPAPARGHEGDSHLDAPPSGRDTASMGAPNAPAPDMTTLEPTQPIVIEAPTSNDQVATACIVDVPESPTQDSSPEVAMPAQEPPPTVSVHPLAALGLPAPHVTKPSTEHESQPELPNETAQPEPRNRQDRTTLMGLAADSETAAIEPASPPIALEPAPEPPRESESGLPTPPVAPEPAPPVAGEAEIPAPAPALPVAVDAVRPALDAVAEPTPPMAFQAPHVEDRPSVAPQESRPSTIPPSGGVVPLASVLKKSEPPPVPTTDDLAQSVAATIGAEMITKLGPEIQARIVELVAQRVAAAVAQQVLESMTHPSLPVARPKPSRAPVTKVTDSEIPEESAAPKRQRKRVAKH